MTAEVRRARIGVTLCFILNGLAWSTLVPRFPELKRQLEIADVSWGVILSLGPIGGLVFGMLAARLIRRFQSAGVAVIMQTLGIACLNVLGNAPAWWVFAFGIMLMTSFDSLCDVAMNAHGMRVQERYGRSILNGLHGWWSVGAVVGGLIGSAAAQTGVAIWVQCLVASLTFGVIALLAKNWMLDGPDPVPQLTCEDQVRRFMPARLLVTLIALGLLGGMAGVIEDAAASWGAIYMDRLFQVTPFVAGLAFVSLQGAQTISRFVCDRIVDALGVRATITLGLAVATVGIGAAVAWPSTWLTLVGLALAGWGIAAVFPGVMHVGHCLPGLPQGTGLTLVASLGRTGFLVGPPIIGATIELVGLRWALLVLVAAGILGLLLTPALGSSRRRCPSL